MKRRIVTTDPRTGSEIVTTITKNHKEITVTVDLSGKASLMDLIVGSSLKRIVDETFDCG